MESDRKHHRRHTAFKPIGSYKIAKGKRLDQEIRLDQVYDWTTSSTRDYRTNTDGFSLIDTVAISQPFDYVYGAPKQSVGVVDLYPSKRAEGVPIAYKADLESLRVSLSNGYNGHCLSIKNSWHAWHQGNNAGRFTFKNVRDALIELDDRLGISCKQMEVNKLAWGINMIDEKSIWRKAKSHRGKDMIPMVDFRNGKEYGRRLIRSEYNVKFYDKTYQTKRKNRIEIGAPITRIEVEGKSKRFIRNALSVFTTNDITTKSEIIKTNLMQTVQDIEFDQWDLSRLSTSEMKLVSVMSNSTYREAYKRNSPNSYRKDRLRYRNLIDQYQGQFKEDITRQIQLELDQC